MPQRVQDIAKAKQLMAAAGHAKGFNVTLATDSTRRSPQLAQVIKRRRPAIGVNINLKVESQTAYYGKATFGNSDWLDSTMSLVDYGDRGVPNVFLDAPLTTKGAWNAAHFHNPTYDKLFTQYMAAIDLQTQKQLAGKIETLLLERDADDHPVLHRRPDGDDPDGARRQPDVDLTGLPRAGLHRTDSGSRSDSRLCLSARRSHSMVDSRVGRTSPSRVKRSPGLPTAGDPLAAKAIAARGLVIELSGDWRDHRAKRRRR